jgi:hypothetical protein
MTFRLGISTGKASFGRGGHLAQGIGASSKRLVLMEVDGSPLLTYFSFDSRARRGRPFSPSKGPLMPSSTLICFESCRRLIPYKPCSSGYPTCLPASPIGIMIKTLNISLILRRLQNLALFRSSTTFETQAIPNRMIHTGP